MWSLWCAQAERPSLRDEAEKDGKRKVKELSTPSLSPCSMKSKSKRQDGRYSVAVVVFWVADRFGLPVWSDLATERQASVKSPDRCNTPLFCARVCDPLKFQAQASLKQLHDCDLAGARYTAMELARAVSARRLLRRQSAWTRPKGWVCSACSSRGSFPALASRRFSSDLAPTGAAPTTPSPASGKPYYVTTPIFYVNAGMWHAVRRE